MNKHHHYCFNSTQFNQEVAHGGVGSIFTCRVSSNVEGHAFNFLDLTIVPSGSTIGVHTHKEDNEEIYIVISGIGRMYLNGTEFDVRAGDVIVNNPSGTHGLKNIGEEELKLVVLELPFDPHSLKKESNIIDGK